MAELTTLAPWQNPDQPQDGRTWKGAMVEGVGNIIPSTIKAGGEIIDAVMSPIETGHTILKLMQGTMHLVLPDEIQQRFDPEGKTEESQQMARAVGQYFANKYGGEENIKEVIATDPASVLMDIATVLTAGGAIVSKVGQLTSAAKVSTVGNTLKTAGTYVDPITGIMQGTGKIAGLGIAGARELSGAVTGTGGGTLSQTFDSARVGANEGKILAKGDRKGKGEEGILLDNALRNGADLQGVVAKALRNLEVMKKQKQSQYKENMKDVVGDNTQLEFTDIDAAIKRGLGIVKYGDTVKNPIGLEKIQELTKIVEEWRNATPETHHTPQGMDALKQRMWSVVESTPMENATARAVAQNIYHSVKDTIAAQAPTYAKTMQDYNEASELIQQITRTLSLPQGKKGNIDTAIRKLTSVMRDNVNTNFSQRMTLAKQLEDVGGEKFISELAGQQMSSLMPRNIQGAITPTAGTAAGLSGAIEPMTSVGILASSSPRVAGEVASMGGYIMGKLDKLPTPSYQGIEALLEILYQTQAQMENKQNQ